MPRKRRRSEAFVDPEDGMHDGVVDGAGASDAELMSTDVDGGSASVSVPVLNGSDPEKEAETWAALKEEFHESASRASARLPPLMRRQSSSSSRCTSSGRSCS
jgi:hypothetical protein